MLTGIVRTASIAFAATAPLTTAEHATLTKLCSDAGLQPHKWALIVAADKQTLLADCATAGVKVAVMLGKPAHELISGHPFKQFRGYAEFHIESKLWHIATIHPCEVIKQQSEGILLFAAIRKALRYLYGDIPTVFAPYIETSPRAERAIEYLRWLAADPTLPVAIDFETAPNGTPTFIGITHKEDWAMSIKLVRTGGASLFNADDETSIWQLLAAVCSQDRAVVAHNWLFDAQVMRHWCGIDPLKFADYHDTMLMFGSCWPDLERSLGFAAAFYLDVPAWKHLSGVDMGLYNGLDACRTLQLWYKLRSEVAAIAPRTYLLDRALLPEAIDRSLQPVGGVYYTHSPYPSSYSSSFGWRTTDHPFLRPTKKRGGKGPYDDGQQLYHDCIAVIANHIAFLQTSPLPSSAGHRPDELLVALTCDAGPRQLMPLTDRTQSQSLVIKQVFESSNPKVSQWRQHVRDSYSLNGGIVRNAAGRERRFTGRGDDSFWHNVYRWWIETSAMDLTIKKES